MVPELRRAIGAEGRALLKRFNLLNPLVEQMVTREAIASVVVSEEKLTEARLGLLQQRGYEGMEQWKQLLEELGRSEEEVLERVCRASACASCVSVSRPRRRRWNARTNLIRWCTACCENSFWLRAVSADRPDQLR